MTSKHMENIIYELNGKKYLLVELIITGSSYKESIKNVEKYNGIYQGIKETKQGGLFSSGYVIIKVLIPEENIVAFNSSESIKL